MSAKPDYVNPPASKAFTEIAWVAAGNKVPEAAVKESVPEQAK